MRPPAGVAPARQHRLSRSAVFNARIIRLGFGSESGVSRYATDCNFPRTVRYRLTKPHSICRACGHPEGIARLVKDCWLDDSDQAGSGPADSRGAPVQEVTAAPLTRRTRSSVKTLSA
ncbi:MAG: hypothetical protein Ct9H300mP1_33700 [Planctomycetaceae bacterium]|nr:MAG: hypothetical protein Ct9H300mP1_33700 [Planctomycetaceae bacterium]